MSAPALPPPSPPRPAKRSIARASGRAEVGVTLSVGEGGRIAWLPQETIVFDRSAFARRLDVDLADGAEALIARGDRVRPPRHGRARRARPFPRPLARQPGRAGWSMPRISRIGPASRRRLAAGGHRWRHRRCNSADGLAASRILARRRRATSSASEGGASAWTSAESGKLLARLFAGDGYRCASGLFRSIELLNGRAGLPKVWSL